MSTTSNELFLMNLKKSAMHRLGSFPPAYRLSVMELIEQMHSDIKFHLEHRDQIDEQINQIAQITSKSVQTSRPNPDLAKSLGISPHRVKMIAQLQDMRVRIEAELKVLTDQYYSSTEDRTEIQTRVDVAFGRWEANEFELQKLWGFEQSKDYHRSFRIPGCMCPKTDNEELVGTSRRYVNKQCCIHG